VKYVHEVLLVSDGAIRRAQELLWDRLRLVGEPGGCAALAAVISGRYRPAAEETVAVIVSGANTTAVTSLAESTGSGRCRGSGNRPYPLPTGPVQVLNRWLTQTARRPADRRETTG
jgi:threonine dehydratase